MSIYDKLIGAYHLGSLGSNHWTLVVMQNILTYDLTKYIYVVTGVGTKF